MCSGCRNLLPLIAVLVTGCESTVPTVSDARPTSTQPATPQRVIRIAADPNNLPFSNDRLEGFENKIADLIAKDLDAKVEYVWRAQRRGFFRQTLKEGTCDLVLGVPKGFDMALTTAPYYRSTYVVVTRKDRALNIGSFDDPRLKDLRIGVQVIGNDGFDTPPAHALARRGLAQNLVGYTLYGDYTQANPPARIVDAVANGDIDLAFVWGPLAGYFAKRQAVPLQVVPLDKEKDGPDLRMAFSIAMGVRRSDAALCGALNQVLARHLREVQTILDEYGVPRAKPVAASAAAAMP